MDRNSGQKLDRDFNELTTLSKGERYTLVTMSDFGIGVHSMQFTLEDIKVSSYAQYSESVQLIFKIKGTRKLRGLRFYGSKSFAIWKGWQDINTEAFTASTETEVFTISKSLYLSFDEQYLTDAIASAPIAPLFSKLNEKNQYLEKSSLCKIKNQSV